MQTAHNLWEDIKERFSVVNGPRIQQLSYFGKLKVLWDELVNSDKISSCTCSHCGKNGHDMKGCFQLIGYPEWWGDKPKSEGKWNGRGRQGMRNKGNPTRANVAHAVKPTMTTRNLRWQV